MSGQSTASSSALHPAIAAGFKDCRRAFWTVAVFSGCVNILVLAGPLYMLQVYDRVLTSRSIPTLVALTVFLIGAYAFQGALDLIRARVVTRAASLLDQHLVDSVHGAVVREANRGASPQGATQPLRDLDQIRDYLIGSGPIAIVDLPWMPIFMAVCFAMHPLLGSTAIAGAAILLGLTFLTERASRVPERERNQHGGLRRAMIEADRRNSESVVAMGMADVLARRWEAVNGRYLDVVGRSSDVIGTFGSISRVIRLLLQSLILGLGAFLVIKGELAAGAMIAASIMVGRALSPIETLIANWRALVAARQSVRRLSATLARTPPPRRVTDLPKPSRSFEVENLAVAGPGSETAIVRDVRFRLEAGEALGIVGTSGAGKTSLVRVLVGIWPAGRGAVRLDGATLDQWDSAFLGRQVGFVSQSVELFDGTVSENIARMSDVPDSAAVVASAKAAGAHDMILRFSAGYDTAIGESGTVLSGGQRQRIALARALYGDPFLLVLDEAGSNLDNEGEVALQAAIRAAKARGAVVIVVAHKPSALVNCDKVLMLANGVQQAYGPREEILQKIVPRKPPAAGATNLKVVRDPVVTGAER